MEHVDGHCVNGSVIISVRISDNSSDGRHAFVTGWAYRRSQSGNDRQARATGVSRHQVSTVLKAMNESRELTQNEVRRPGWSRNLLIRLSCVTHKTERYKDGNHHHVATRPSLPFRP